MRTFASFSILLLALACKPQARPIDYGNQACDYCRMNIVDDRYASELVTDHNKVFCFDAIECMIKFQNENHDHQYALKLVTDYTSPGTLIPASEAVILRSKELPSPMGMYLTAVKGQEEAESLQQHFEGELYQFNELEENIKTLPAL